MLIKAAAMQCLCVLVMCMLCIVYAGPNIIVLLADDLGYGDISVPPFNASSIRTPHLEQMALSGTTLTNFHVAAPVCSPSRAAILSGLFPWRLGIYSIFGTGPQKDGHMLAVQNTANIFVQHGYYTAHVGKWHLGGLKPSDLKLRKAFRTTGKCPADAHPGPNQHGFDEYVSMPEGPGSARLEKLLPSRTLYHEGAQHLVRNDEPLAPSNDILTDRQVSEAMRIISESAGRKQPFFLQLWFDAPHTPWELIKPFDQQYRSRHLDDTALKYATMISSMDSGIGRLREGLRQLRIENDTIIVFLSDNGPENGAGLAEPYQGRKRSLLEGGIRVPCIWSWPNHIPAQRASDKFMISTDLLPTFLDMANLPMPHNIRLDGRSMTRLLLGSSHRFIDHDHGSRMALWHKDIGGRAGAAWASGHKLVDDHDKGSRCLFNMTSDPTEQRCIALPQAKVGQLVDDHFTALARSLEHKLQIFTQEVSKFFQLHNLFIYLTVCLFVCREVWRAVRWRRSRTVDCLHPLLYMLCHGTRDLLSRNLVEWFIPTNQTMKVAPRVALERDFGWQKTPCAGHCTARSCKDGFHR